MSRVSIAELEPFLAVARALSFRRAAEARGVSASALSQTIRQLEERLDVRLFNRTTRSVALTEAGERLLRHIEPAFDDIAQALDQVHGSPGEPAGRVRINAPAPVVEYLIAPRMTAFLLRYPRVSLEVLVNAAYVDIVAQGYDAGVRVGEEVAQDMIAIPFGPPLEYAIVGSPDYLARRGEPTTPEALLQHECVGFRFPGGSLFAWSFDNGQRAVELTPDSRLIVNDARHGLRAAREGWGLARVPLSYALPELAEGRVRRVLEAWTPSSPRWYLYYPGRRRMPSALRAFIDYFVKSELLPDPAVNGP